MSRRLVAGKLQGRSASGLGEHLASRRLLASTLHIGGHNVGRHWTLGVRTDIDCTPGVSVLTLLHLTKPSVYGSESPWVWLLQGRSSRKYLGCGPGVNASTWAARPRMPSKATARNSAGRSAIAMHRLDREHLDRAFGRGHCKHWTVRATESWDNTLCDVTLAQEMR